MSDDRKPGYDFFPPARPTTQTEIPPDYRPTRNPPTGPTGPIGSTGFVGAGPAAPTRPISRPHPMSSLLPGQHTWADQIPPVRRSGMPGWLIVLILLVFGLIGTGVLAAIAVPVFLSQRLKAEHQGTTVQLPTSFNGTKRNTGAAAKKVAQGFAVGGIKAEDVAVYGKVGPKAVIILAVKPPAPWTDSEQSAQRSEIEQGFAAQGTPLFLLREPDPGELGGWIGCGATSQGLEVCLATSVGSLVSVITAAGGDDPVALLRQARAATVRHS
jgi:hypothetical protein